MNHLMTAPKANDRTPSFEAWRRAVLASLAFSVLFVLLLASSAVAQETPDGELVRLWIEARDAQGKIVDELAPEDVEVREGLAAAPENLRVVADGPARRAQGPAPTRFIIYIDQALSSKGTARRASEGFAGIARSLIELGDVEVVMAGDTAESVLDARDELVLEERLKWSATRNPAEDRILALRTTTLDDARRLRRAPVSTTEEIAQRVRSGILEELELIADRLDELIAWTAGQIPAGGRFDRPRVLFFISNGFDLDPLEFYGERLDMEVWRQALRQTPEALVFEARVRDAARALAALGVTVIPVRLEAVEEERRFEPSYIDTTDSQGRQTGGAGVTIRPGAIFGRDDKDETATEPSAAFIDPTAPLRILAQATGGEVLANERGLNDVVERFAERFEITYRSFLTLDAGVRPLNVEPRRQTLTLKAPEWRSRTTPADVLRARLEHLLEGRRADGELDVAAVLEVERGPDDTVSGTLETRLQLTDLYADEATGEELPRPRDAAFRVTIGVARSGGIPSDGAPSDAPSLAAPPSDEGPRIESEIVTGQDLDGLIEWSHRRAMELAGGSDEVAVIVEELGDGRFRGRWGGSRAGVVSSPTGGAERIVLRPTVIEIEPPGEDVLRGRMKFTTRTFDGRVDRVLFRLDERDVAEVDKRPFEARLDLGRSPRRQTLTAIAFDDAGEELGRHSVILNAGGVGLEVAIVSPEDDQGTGPVDVEASIAVPVERRLDRVLFFWNSDLVATLFTPPFRQEILIPEERPMGYVRVVAMLDDGTVAEDVRFMNGPGSGERIDVSLVELYVVVADRDGRPVDGLARDDFVVREEGEEQEIATFSAAADLPLTLGMAIDSSSSMFVKLPQVQRAATRFLRSTMNDHDRAFVVDFDSQPRLVRTTTSELDYIERSIDSLEASGRTALWESVVYSLVQLQGVRGRKALIVFSDGADEDDDFPFRSCLDFARKMGVPIYLILMRHEPDGGGLSLFARSFKSRVDRLVETTGGRVFYAKEYDHLDAVYEEIERELRSQYLLTYYPEEADPGGRFRKVKIEVKAPNLEPRTLSGYWP